MSEGANRQFFAGSSDFHERCAAPTVVTIGNFDGVHLGHQTLLNRTIELARAQGALSVVYTFEPSPRRLLAPQLFTPRISSWDEKVQRLFELGIDCVVIERFSKAFAQHPPQWFAQTVIANRLSAKAVVVGYDFRFGRARAGTGEMLKQMLPELVVEELPPLRLQLSGSDESTVISSSLIRQQLLAGETHTASLLLGRPYCISGVVVGGDKRGRRIGYPTANIETDANLMPAAGVYAVQVELEDGVYEGMLNLGTRPTFGGRKSTIEVHVFDFDRDIYGDSIRIVFYNRIRSERRFKSSSELRDQLDIDQQRARELLSQVGQTEQNDHV